MDFKVPSSTSMGINGNRTASWTEYLTSPSNTLCEGYILFCNDIHSSTYPPLLENLENLHYKIKHNLWYLAENSSGIKALVLKILI
jgi:hypothetical protein